MRRGTERGLKEESASHVCFFPFWGLERRRKGRGEGKGSAFRFVRVFGRGLLKSGRGREGARAAEQQNRTKTGAPARSPTTAQEPDSHTQKKTKRNDLTHLRVVQIPSHTHAPTRHTHTPMPRAVRQFDEPAVNSIEVFRVRVSIERRTGAGPARRTVRTSCLAASRG